MAKKKIYVKEAAYLAGFRSPQMLDYLERQQLFVREEVRSNPRAAERRRGRRREYTFRDLVILRAINNLLAKGVSVERIRRAITAFGEDVRFQCDRRSLRYSSQAFQYLVTDGTEIYFHKSRMELPSLLEDGQLAFLFIMDVEAAREEVISAEKPAAKKA